MTIKPHYVPCGYLNSWASRRGGDECYCYAYAKSDERWFSPNIKGIMKKSHLYSDQWEDTLQKLDTKYTETARFVVDCRHNISTEEREILATFITAQLHRVPARLVAFEPSRQLLRSYPGAGLFTPGGCYPADEVSGICDDPMVNMFLSQIEPISIVVNEMRISRIYTDDPLGFITSDNPVGMINSHWAGSFDASGGFRNPHLKISLPISPDCCLRFGWQDEAAIFDISGSQAELFFYNSHMALCAQEHVVARKKEWNPLWLADRATRHWESERLNALSNRRFSLAPFFWPPHMAIPTENVSFSVPTDL